MNKKLLKQLIRFKLDAAGAVIEHMPWSLSKGVREFGVIILEALNERMQDIKEPYAGKENASGGINNIPVE